MVSAGLIHSRSCGRCPLVLGPHGLASSGRLTHAVPGWLNWEANLQCLGGQEYKLLGLYHILLVKASGCASLQCKDRKINRRGGKEMWPFSTLPRIQEVTQKNKGDLMK